MGGGLWMLPHDRMTALILGGAGLLVTILGVVVLAFSKLWVRTSANESFYRTGWLAPRVIIDGGAMVVPGLQQLTRVLLETMKLEVERRGEDALICKDFLRVDVAAEFYIRVNKSVEGVKAAATTMGRDAAHPEAIKSRMMEKLVSALRTVAATMDLNELHQNREEFASRVQEAIEKDIAPNGFVLETVTISQLDQTDVSNLKSDNVFDAQGLRKAAEITQAQLVSKNQIEKRASLAIETENVATRRAVLEQIEAREVAEADQTARVQAHKAEREREVAEFELAQQELVERRRVEKERQVRAAEIQREAALVEEEKARETAEVVKAQAIEVARREQAIRVAEAEARRADAEAEQRLAEAKEREAAEKVVTVAALEAARRQKEQAVIKAEQEGETALIELQKAADADAYAKLREAAAEREAAENRATAQIRLAEAALEAKRREAEGRKQVEMIPVQVEAERVDIEARRVEVLRQELEAKDAHQEAAIHLELARERVRADKEVGIAMAEAMGRFMSKGQFQIFGDPTTLADMTERFSQGLGVSQWIGGLQEGNPLLGKVVENGLQAASAGLDAARAQAGELLQAAAEASRRATGEDDGDGDLPDAPAPRRAA